MEEAGGGSKVGEPCLRNLWHRDQNPAPLEFTSNTAASLDCHLGCLTRVVRKMWYADSILTQ